MGALLERLDRGLGTVVMAGRWLVLPVALTLFLQWPLRDWIARGSREANDLGQWLFALYVCLAVTAATRAGAHLAADALAQRYPAATRQAIAVAGAALCVVPWALFIVVGGAAFAWNSASRLESFPDTGNSGYFIVKGCAWLLAALALAQAVLDVARATWRR